MIQNDSPISCIAMNETLTQNIEGPRTIQNEHRVCQNSRLAAFPLFKRKQSMLLDRGLISEFLTFAFSSAWTFFFQSYSPAEHIISLSFIENSHFVHLLISISFTIQLIGRNHFSLPYNTQIFLQGICPSFLFSISIFLVGGLKIYPRPLNFLALSSMLLILPNIQMLEATKKI